MRPRMLPGALLLCLVAACGDVGPASATEPDLADYDASCGVPADCQLVQVRDQCSACDGDWAVLNEAGAEAFEADQADWLAACEVMQAGCGTSGITPEALMTAGCDDGLCTLSGPSDTGETP